MINWNHIKKIIEKNTKNKIQIEVLKEINDKKEPKTIYNFNIINENEIDILIKQYAENHKEPLTSYTISRSLFCYEKISYADSNGQNAYGLKRKEK